MPTGLLENWDKAAAALGEGRPALVWRRLIADTETPVGAAVKLIEPGRGDFLLESVEGGEIRGRHSLIGLAPDLLFRAHGQQAGIGPHWELWSFVRGGMTPVEALRAGTIVSAQSLGMARDIGSLEVGKLADLVVLDADPTQDIRNSDKVHRVMLGGRLYDPVTLDEVATGTWKRAAYWWETASRSD